MRVVWGLCALLIALGAPFATAQAQVIVTFQPGPYSPSGYVTSLALEITDAPPTVTEGHIKIGDIIARHTARLAEAVVLDQDVQGRKRVIPAGTVMVHVNTGPKTVVWCDMRPRGSILLPDDQVDCLEDSTGSGAFDRLWNAHTLDFFGPFGASAIDKQTSALSRPARHHPAEPEQRSILSVGYRYCDGDGVVTPPRFAVVLSPIGKPSDLRLDGLCREGVWKSVDKSEVGLDRLMLHVTPSAGGGLDVKLENRLQPGPIVDLSPGRPIRHIDQVSVLPAGAAHTYYPQPTSEEQIFKAKGPATVANGLARRGVAIVSEPVEHRYTGVLKARIRPGISWRGDTPLEVDQPMFAIPMGPAVAWCAPRTAEGVTGLVASCLVPTGYGHVWLPQRKPALMPVESLQRFGQSGTPSTEPTVEQKPVTFPPMTLSYVLGETHPSKKAGGGLVFDLDLMVDWGEGPQKIWTLPLEPGVQGLSGRLLGKVIKFTVGDDPTTLVVSG